MSDSAGASSIDDVTVNVGAPPVPTISSPRRRRHSSAPTRTSASAARPAMLQDGTIPASGLDWTRGPPPLHRGRRLPHPSAAGVRRRRGRASSTMPAHERPYYLTLTLTATDSTACRPSTSVDVYPKPNEAPVPTIESPDDGSRFTAGERIAFAGGAIDREDGDVPAVGAALGPGRGRLLDRRLYRGAARSAARRRARKLRRSDRRDSAAAPARADRDRLGGLSANNGRDPQSPDSSGSRSSRAGIGPGSRSPGSVAGRHLRADVRQGARIRIAHPQASARVRAGQAGRS